MEYTINHNSIWSFNTSYNTSFGFFFCHHQVYQIIKYFDEGIIATVISKDRT